jgi:hypothetical protein
MLHTVAAAPEREKLRRHRWRLLYLPARKSADGPSAFRSDIFDIDIALSLTYLLAQRQISGREHAEIESRTKSQSRDRKLIHREKTKTCQIPDLSFSVANIR